MLLKVDAPIENLLASAVTRMAFSGKKPWHVENGGGSQERTNRTYHYQFPGGPSRLFFEWFFRKDYCFSRDLQSTIQGDYSFYGL